MTAAKNAGMWHRGVKKGVDHSIAPGGAWTFANPTCGASARLVNLYSSYVCDFVLFCLVSVVSMCFLPAMYRRGVRYGSLVCFAFDHWFFLLNPFLAMISFAGYFHARFLLSAFCPACLFCFVFADRVHSRFVLV